MLSGKLGKPIQIFSSSPVSGGCMNNASKLITNGGDFFLKWNSACASDIFIREAESLRELKKAAGDYLVVPEVFAEKQIDDTPGFLVLEFLEPGFHSSIDEKLGRGLAAVHRYSGSMFGFYNDNYCGATYQNNEWKTNWPGFFRENRLGFLLSLIQNNRPFRNDEFKIFEKLLERIDILIPGESVPVLIHGDLWSGNCMITDKGPALVDPAPYYADREMEFAIITMFGGFSQRFFASYNEADPLPADWKRRNNLYQLYHVLNHFYLFGGGYRNQALQIAKSYL